MISGLDSLRIIFLFYFLFLLARIVSICSDNIFNAMRIADVLVATPLRLALIFCRCALSFSFGRMVMVSVMLSYTSVLQSVKLPTCKTSIHDCLTNLYSRKYDFTLFFVYFKMGIRYGYKQVYIWYYPTLPNHPNRCGLYIILPLISL